jgi:hypothetical protein
MDVVHRPDTELVDADYWSCLDANLTYDPLLCKYQHLTHALKRAHPSPTALPMDASNMPYFCGPCIRADLPAATPTHDTMADCHISVIPPNYGRDSGGLIHTTPPTPTCYNAEIACASHALSAFRWAIYSFNTVIFSHLSWLASFLSRCTMRATHLLPVVLSSTMLGDALRSSQLGRNTFITSGLMATAPTSMGTSFTRTAFKPRTLQQNFGNSKQQLQPSSA